MKYANIKLLSVTALTTAMSFLPATTLAAGPQARAVCENGTITISMTPPANHKRWAIRIDDKSNSFQPTEMRPGDTLIDNYKQNTFSREAQMPEMYNWWIHSISQDNKWSEVTGGPVACGPAMPANLSGSYDQPEVTIQWKPVKGAVKYAIRTDNTVNPWTPDAMQDGDHLRDSYTETTFKFKASPDRKIVFWVHAIDANGVWSQASWANFTTK